MRRCFGHYSDRANECVKCVLAEKCVVEMFKRVFEVIE